MPYWELKTAENMDRKNSRGRKMIRKMEKTDLNQTADIWLEGNLKAHSFISSKYWMENLEPVKEMLLEAEVYVYEKEGRLLGFAGLYEDYIAGIFVREQERSQGIGRELLNCIKEKKAQSEKSCISLKLHVYEKNDKAIKFYLREGFAVEKESTDEDTGEKEYLMLWKNS